MSVQQTQTARARERSIDLPLETDRSILLGMSSLADIEKAIEALPPEEWWKIRRWMESQKPKSQTVEECRQLPLVPATGRVITQEQVDDALD
jgi:hypothetical protein